VLGDFDGCSCASAIHMTFIYIHTQSKKCKYSLTHSLYKKEGLNGIGRTMMFLEEELNSLDESGEVLNADFKLIRRTKVSVIIIMLPIKLVLELEFLN